MLEALAEIYIAKGELHEAIDCYRGLINFLFEAGEAEIPDINPVEWKLGLLYEEIGDLENAKQQFENCTNYEQSCLDDYGVELPEAREHSKHLKQLLVKMKKQKTKRRR